MKLILIAAVFSAIVVGYGTPQNILAREEWSQTRAFKWKVITEVSFGKSAMQELQHTPPGMQAQLPRNGNLSLRKRRTEAVLSIKRIPDAAFVEYEIIQSTDFPKQKYRFVCAKSYLAISSQQSNASEGGAPPMAGGTAIVVPTAGAALYAGIPTLLAGTDELQSFHPAFHAGADPTASKVPFGWMGILPIDWIAHNQDPEQFSLRVQHTDVGTLRLDRQRGYAPLELEVRQGHVRYHWKTLEWKKFGDHWFPSEVEYQYTDRAVNHIARFSLVSVEVSSDEEVPLFSLGEPVIDYRLRDSVVDAPQRSKEKVVSYIWQGRLPTEEELKQLAYQQGNLIPPETPRRRFSPLLFAPAVILFALAAYLYFKKQRR